MNLQFVPKNKQRRAFSLIEVIIGLAILFVVISFILVALRGRETESRKSAKFFNAVFLAQKIVDDLDNRCRENIYAVNELAEKKGTYRIVEGGEPLFQYLEDTNSNGKLDDDLAITEVAGSIYGQFKDFTYQVNFDRSHGNGLARADVLVRWEDRGEQSYRVSQVLPDLPGKVESDVGSLLEIELTDEMIRNFLFPEEDPLDELLEKYKFDRTLAEQLARVQYISRAAAKSINDTDAAILQIQNSRKGATLDGMLEMAKMREENAIKIVQCYGLLLLPLSEIQKLQGKAAFDFGGFLFNEKLIDLMKDLARLAKNVEGQKNRNCLALRFNLELAEAMNLYLQMITSKDLALELPYNRRVGMLVRVVDLGSALIQNNYDKMIFSIGETRITLKNLVMNSFTTLQAILSGRDYNRASYVGHKIATIQSGKFREFEDISERLLNMAAVSELSGGLMKDIAKSIEKVKTPEAPTKKPQTPK